MRARRYNGNRAVTVRVPAWVKLGVAPELHVGCARCGAREALDTLARADAERALGRFCQFHSTCFDRDAPRPTSVRRVDERRSLIFIRKRSANDA